MPFLKGWTARHKISSQKWHQLLLVLHDVALVPEENGGPERRKYLQTRRTVLLICADPTGLPLHDLLTSRMTRRYPRSNLGRVLTYDFHLHATIESATIGSCIVTCGFV